MAGNSRPACRQSTVHGVLLALPAATLLTLAPATVGAQRRPPSAPAATVARAPESSALRLGAQLDVGVPDLLGASLVVRPLRWLRVHGGATTSLIGFGLRGGVTLAPFHTTLSPSLTLEGGHAFEMNANKLTARFGLTSAALERVSYSYGNAHLGLELGSPDSCLFYLHGGLSVLRSTLQNTQQLVQQQTGNATVTFSDPRALAIVPTAKIGVLLYL